MSTIIEVFQGHNIAIRPNGYWNGTALCNTEGRQIEEFLGESSVNRYLEALAEDLGLPLLEVVEPNFEGEPRALIHCVDRGEEHRWEIWVHEEVALKLTGWLNPRLEIWFHRTIKKLLKEGQVLLKEEIEGLKAALNKSEEFATELSNEYARLEHDFDRHKYIVDELKRDMHWHRINSWQ